MGPVSTVPSARREKLIVILGPTASGKTALSVELAKALHTEILSGDSMLVYRGFDIGAAKPDEAERQGVAHHLIDICAPDEAYSVPLFQQQAKAIIHRLNEQGKVPILAGGTGLYVKERVDRMVEAGLEQEVRGLLARGVTREMPAMKGIGYKEMASYLAGEITREEAVEAIKTGTRHFAKRQMTWYRKMKYIHWYEPEGCTADELLQRILTDMAGFLPE